MSLSESDHQVNFCEQKLFFSFGPVEKRKEKEIHFNMVLGILSTYNLPKALPQHLY